MAVQKTSGLPDWFPGCGFGQRARKAVSLLLAALCLGAPGAAPLAMARIPADSPVPVAISRLPFEAAAPCTGTFVAHDLPHTTTTNDGVIRMFEGNGSGIAVGDLDNDGDHDVILGNLDGPNTLLWNQGRRERGELTFTRATFGDPDTRALSLVDVDADGFLDVVLTRHTGVLTYWRNTGEGQAAAGSVPFERRILAGVGRPAYVLNWADTDKDGDLDLATATYDAGMLTDLGNEYLLAGNGGVFAWENRDGRFRGTQLAREAQALGLIFFDADRNGLPDLLVGNDFGLRDMAFLNRHNLNRHNLNRHNPNRHNPESGPSWQLAEPFAHTTHSTMNLEAGDVHNDGRLEIFATDMKPYDPQNPAVAMAWAPMMASMTMHHDPYDPQIMENVLLVLDDSDMYYNVSQAVGVDATGWSWSARFGDLDLDGALDLYVVNGFTEETMLAHLPNHELVEANQALRNDGTGKFDAAPEWALDSLRSGRGMVMADMDNDGDLDILINNVRAPAAFHENRLCVPAFSSALRMRLQQPQTHNRNAIGAQVVLYTNHGRMTRTVVAGSAYLSAEAPEVHFGLGAGMRIARIEITWPDGATSSLAPLEPGAFYTITRQ